MIRAERDKIKMYLLLTGRWIYDELSDCSMDSFCWFNEELDNWCTYEGAYGREQAKRRV